VVTLTLNPSEDVGTPTCTFTDTSGAMADTSVTYGTVSDDSHTAAVTVHDSDADGAFGFSCTYSDLAGNAIASAITAASSGDIDIDNTHPTWTSVTFASGDYVNNAEDESAINLVIITVGVDNSQVVTATLNSAAYTCTIASNACTAVITGAGLRALTNGNSYTFSVAVSDDSGNAATADTSESFTYDITAPTSTTAVESTSGDGDANDGDVFTVTLNPSEAVGTPVCTFTDTSGAMDDTSVTYGTVSDDSHTAAVTVHNSDADGAIGFSCTYSDLAGNAIAAAITTATSGDIDIDNTHPSISSVAADWGAYLNAAEDNSDGTITVVTSGAEDGEVVTITGNGDFPTDTCSVSSNTCDATILAATYRD